MKFSGTAPQKNIAVASVPTNVVGGKYAFTHRSGAVVQTGLSVITPAGYKLQYRLVPQLAGRGMVAPEAPGGLVQGQLVVPLINCGREIVEIRPGDPVVEVWLEPELGFEWEAE